MFLVSGVFNIYTNANGNGCIGLVQFMQEHKMADTKENRMHAKEMMSKDQKTCEMNLITQLSLANKRKDSESMLIQGWLNVATVLLIVVVLQFFRKRQREITHHCDVEDVSASDYTVVVENIPQGLEVNYKDKIKSTFKEAGFNVVKVTPCFRFDHQLEQEKKKAEIIKEKKEAMAYFYKVGSYKEGVDIASINKKISEVEDKLEEFEEMFWNCGVNVAKDFCGVAYVSFITEQEKEDVLEKYKLTNSQIHKIHVNEHSSLKLENLLKMNDNILIIKQAPDPTDVIWENQMFTYKDKRKRKIIADIASITMLLLGGLCIYLLTALQISEKKEAAKSTDKKAGVPIMVKIIAVLISVAIVVINNILSITFTKLAEYEKHSTKTHFNVSLAKNLSVAQFSNTALMTFLITFFIVKNYYGNGGLIYNQYFVFIMNLVVPNVMGFINIGYVVKSFLRKKERKKDNKSLLTQAEAQKLFENPPYDISKAYADLLKTIYFTCFYAAIIPIGVFLSLVAIGILYWVHKLNILKRANIPYGQGYELSLEMTEYLEFSIIIFSV